jgi:sarcosine oxidase subunit beta
MRWRAEVNKHLGVSSELVDRDFIKRQCPEIDLDCGLGMPILGALYHPPGAIARHDAVAWGYARAADRLGVEIHQNTEVTGIRVESGRVTGVDTNRGFVATPRVLSAVAGYTPRITDLIGIRTPITVHPLQAAVSEPLKPWLNSIIVSGSLHIYVSQSSRTSCSVMCDDVGDVPGYRVWVEPSYGHYLWQVLHEIVTELGGGPIGWECLEHSR